MKTTNPKKRFNHTLWKVLLVVWMAVIFSFSARPAPESTQMSHTVGKLAGRLLVPEYPTWSRQRQEAFAAQIDYPIRKGTHMTEFAVLGILLSMVAGTMYGQCEEIYAGKRRMRTAVAAGVLYAVSDELHQWFVPGRSCQITDVMIDSCGVILGVLFLELLRRYFSGKKTYIDE